MNEWINNKLIHFFCVSVSTPLIYVKFYILKALANYYIIHGEIKSDTNIIINILQCKSCYAINGPLVASL